MTADTTDVHQAFSEALKICTATAREMDEILQLSKLIDETTAEGRAEQLRLDQLLLETRARFYDEVEDLDNVLGGVDRRGPGSVRHSGSSPVVGA